LTVPRRKRDPEAVRHSQIAKGVRPLWVLPPDNVPLLVSASRRDLVAKARYFCREGDTHWRPIAELDVSGDGGAKIDGQA
jgi:hypothetical protein